MSLPIYEKICHANDWEYELKSVLAVSDDELDAAKTVVNKGLAMLNTNDLVVRRGGPLYPKRLSALPDSPPFLFLRGDALLADRSVLSIVGTRNPTSTGANNARRLSRLLSERHIIVASGLAKGIDRAAHAGTRDAGKPTIAVIGTGLNKAYPAQHKQIQEYIGATGLLVSQFLPSAPVQKWNFPMRNATMSGISIATIVIEASETSGALIQAREALKQGRRVFIPQSAVENPNLKWPKAFVSQKGAQSFTTIDDLMEKLQRENLLAATSSNRESRSTTYTLDVSESATGMQ
ncbi:DNA-processing protein DprA [Alicyclobacillus tolerans]|uniref:DNA-processing protein DprA n=1 Tax=Alicyclobacillus tolerans TaxID=90970 RepID=UPI003B81DAAB